jgi:hypothetical protein
MLQAIADGETNPEALAALADRRLRATQAQLNDALGACNRRSLRPFVNSSLYVRFDSVGFQLACLIVAQARHEAAIHNFENASFGFEPKLLTCLTRSVRGRANPGWPQTILPNARVIFMSFRGPLRPQVTRYGLHARQVT